MTSACDMCPKPGKCCTRLPLFAGTEFMVPRGWKPEDWLRERSAVPLPFVGTEVRTFGDGEDGWWWACPKVTEEGRCSIYKDRPQLCRDFRPGQDPLCAFHGLEVGDPSVGMELVLPEVDGYDHLRAGDDFLSTELK